MDLAEFSSKNFQRAQRWHGKAGIAGWTVSDWLMAMAGEAGEACNAGKKLRRVQDQIANISESESRRLYSLQDALDAIAEELADTVIYCDLVAARIGVSLEMAIQRKFNETSERYGFPERL